MTGALVICSLLVCGALGLSVQTPPDTCGVQHDEVLKNSNGIFLGSSLNLGLKEEESKVSWETASKRLITLPHAQHSTDYEKDVSDEATLQFTYSYGLEPEEAMDSGFDTVEVGGCSVKKTPVAEMQYGSLKASATNIGGLRPIPGNPSHVLLGQRAPRVSFCFPEDASMDGRLVWGAPDPRRGDGPHVTLNIAGGMKAHHWAVNVTGMGMTVIDASGESKYESVLDAHRDTVSKDKSAYWIAVFSTGQNTLVVPKEVLAEIQKHVDTTNLVDCADTSHLPSLHIELDGQAYKVSPKDYLTTVPMFRKQQVLQAATLHFRPKLSGVPAELTDKCVIMLGEPTPFDGVFVLGQPFLRKHATTYDYEKRQITTVPHVGSCWSGAESGATRSYTIFAYMFSVISLAMSFGFVR